MAASNSVLNAYTLPAADSMTPAHQDAEPDAPAESAPRDEAGKANRS